MKLIDTIEIKNFKSIRHQKIEGCKRINVFIGYPNVGKSNILEALSLLSYAKRGDVIPLKYFCRFKELIDLFSDGEKQKDAEIFTKEYVAALRYVDKNVLEFGIVFRENYVEKFNESTAQVLRFIQFNKDGSIANSNVKEYKEKTIVKKYQFSTEGGHSYISANPTVLSYPFGSNLAEFVR